MVDRKKIEIVTSNNVDGREVCIGTVVLGQFRGPDPQREREAAESFADELQRLLDAEHAAGVAEGIERVGQIKWHESHDDLANFAVAESCRIALAAFNKEQADVQV